MYKNAPKYTPELVAQIRNKFPDKPFFRAPTAAECISRVNNLPPIRDNGKYGANGKVVAKANTWYIPIQALGLDGKYYLGARFSVVKQLLGSSVKPQPTATFETSKHVQLLLKKITEEDLTKTIYQPSKYAELLEHNTACIEMLNYISFELGKLLEQMVKSPGDYNADKPAESIHLFCQSSRLDSLTREEVELENYLYRLRVEVDPATKQLGRQFNMDGKSKFEYAVFDAKRKDSRGFPLPAAIEDPETKETAVLTSVTCPNYLNYMSLFSAEFAIRQVVMFKNGISAPVTIYKSFFYSHPRIKGVSAVPDDFDDFVIEEQQSVNVADVDSDAIAIDGQVPLMADAPPAMSYV